MVFDVKGQVREGECKFCGNVILYNKDRMIFHLGYRYDNNGQIGIAMCSKTHPRVKALFAQCGGLVPPPFNNMEVLAHIPNGQTKDVAMETLNPSMEGKCCFNVSSGRGSNFCPLQKT
jgi:hypothetical protein